MQAQRSIRNFCRELGTKPSRQTVKFVVDSRQVVVVVFMPDKTVRMSLHHNGVAVQGVSSTSVDLLDLVWVSPFVSDKHKWPSKYKCVDVA